MRVQRVLMPGAGVESWTLLGDSRVPVEPVERFLAFLASIERSPNTIKAYAHDLKDWFTFLAGHGLDWRVVTLEDVAGYVAWLRLPPAAREGAGGGAADGGPSLQRVEREPQAGRADVVL
jgi:integrase/recombinase XerD